MNYEYLASAMYICGAYVVWACHCLLRKNTCRAWGTFAPKATAIFNVDKAKKEKHFEKRLTTLACEQAS